MTRLSLRLSRRFRVPPRNVFSQSRLLPIGDVVKGFAVIDLAAYYKMYAGIAADMAADTIDPARRASLLEMAQAWRTLAEKEEQSQAGDEKK
jgi:hypothetical protein